MEGCEVAWVRRRGTMALMSAEVPETCRVAGAGGEEGAGAGAVAGGAPPRRGAVRWISQPPGAGAGGGTLLTAKSLLKSWRAAWDRMRGEVCGNLGGQQSLNGGDGAGEGAGAGWTSQTSGAGGEERRTAGGMDVSELALSMSRAWRVSRSGPLEGVREGGGQVWTRGGTAAVEAGVGTMDQEVESMGKEAMGDEAEGGREASSLVGRAT